MKIHPSCFSLALLAASANALANPVGGMQMAAYPEAMEKVSDFTQGLSFSFEEADVGTSYGCYDRIGIENLNVDIVLDTMTMNLGSGTLSIDVKIDEMSGQDMVLYTEDSNWDDACPEFELDFYYFEMRNARMEMTLKPSVVDGALHLEVLGEPSLSGSLDMDLEWVPDDLLLTYFEEVMYDLIASQMKERLPELASKYLDSLAYAGSYEAFDYQAELVDINLSRKAMTMGVDMDFQWNGEGCRVSGKAKTRGRSPKLDLSNKTNSTMGMGFTEKLMNDLFGSAWEEGMMCIGAGNHASLLTGLMATAGFDKGDLEPEFRFDKPPTVDIETNGLTLHMPHFAVAVAQSKGNESQAIFEMSGSFSAAIEPGVDPRFGGITLAVHGLKLKVDHLAAEGLLQDGEDSKARMIQFMEGWIARGLNEQLQEVALAGNVFDINDYVLRLDDIQSEAGGIAAFVSAFSANDPEVDRIAPSTEGWIANASATHLLAQWEGQDDRKGPIAFSWRLNEGAWSPWTTDTHLRLEKLSSGAHTLEIQARDSWWNVDETPAAVQFSLSADGFQEENKGWGCSSTTGSGSKNLVWFGLLSGLLVFGRRRR